MSEEKPSKLSGYRLTKHQIPVRDAEYKEIIIQEWKPAWYVKFLRTIFQKEWEKEAREMQENKDCQIDLIRSRLELDAKHRLIAPASQREAFMQAKLKELGFVLRSHLEPKIVLENEDIASSLFENPTGQKGLFYWEELPKPVVEKKVTKKKTRKKKSTSSRKKS